MKKTLLLLIVLAVPLNGEVRVAARGGLNDVVGTIELDARYRGWSLAPAYEVMRRGYGQHAYHLDLRRLFQARQSTIWVGAGWTKVATNEASENTWNGDLGVAWRRKGRWEPFAAVRYYRYRIPVFRDEVEGSGPVISAGVSFRVY